MPRGLIAHILGHLEELYCVQRDHARVRVMHSATFDVGLRTVAIHMEVDCIASNNFRLSHVLELDVFDARYAPHTRACVYACARLAVYHQMRSVVCQWRICRIAAYVYVT